MLWEDFSIKIEPKRGDSFPVIVLRSPAGEGRSSFTLPFDPDEIGDILFDLGQTVRGIPGVPLRSVSPAATRTGPQKVGDQLFNALFSGTVRSLLDRSLGMIHGRDRGLRIKLHIDPEDPGLALLGSLPWEFLYRKETRDFLNLSRYSPVIRYLNVQRPTIPLPLQPPLRILVVISAPSDYLPLDLVRERALIETSWARQPGVQVEFVERATIFSLQDRLNTQSYHVLHYMGHGDFDERTGQGVLVLEDETGKGTIVDGSTLGVLLRDVPMMRLVFLNACETARATKERGLDPFAGVASALVMAAIPAVVAMQFPISDQAAITFAQKFYPLLASGEPVDAAVAEGRRAIRLADPHTNEWGTPVLFMRAPQGNIFDVRETRAFEPGPADPGEIPPVVDREFEERLEQLYTDGLSAFWLEKWGQAIQHFQTIVNLVPDYEDAAAKLAEASRQARLHELYGRALAAQEAGEWPLALAVLEELAAEALDYKDTAERLETVRQQKHLDDLYTEAKRLFQAEKWPAVVSIFTQILAIDPDYPDPEELRASSEQNFAEQKRLAKTNERYSRAIKKMNAGQWEEARQLFTKVQQAEPGFRDTEKLLAKVAEELEQARIEQERKDRVVKLYEDARARVQSRHWKWALEKIEAIRAIDPAFTDPEGIAARAKEALKKEEEEEEAQRQAELSTQYEGAVRALKAGRYQEALNRWEGLRAREPNYPDPQQVQAKARQMLETLAPAIPPRRTWPGWAWAAGIVIVGCGLLLVIASAIGNLIANSQANATATARARAASMATAAAFENASATDLAQERATATASAREKATGTALAVAGSLPRPTRTPAPPEATPADNLVFGPESESLAHQPEDERIESFYADVEVTDFVAEATFINPYSASTGEWDYGFLGRRPGTGTGQAIRVRSDGNWYHSAILDGEWTSFGSGLLSGLRTDAGQSNHLRFIALGDLGIFFMNGQFVATLDLSAITEPGDVGAVTGTIAGAEREGEATHVEDFKVWSLDTAAFGPASRDILHDPDDGKIETLETDLMLADFVATATFYNPYPLSKGGWDYGYLFRNPEANVAYAIRVSPQGTWSLDLIVDEDGWSDIDSDALEGLRTEAGQSNELLLIAIGSEGVFYLNGEFVTALDLSGFGEPGDVKAATGTYSGNEHEGEATRVELFTVWSLD